MENPTNPHRRVAGSREPEQRQFSLWAKLADDGSVLAIVEVANGAPQPVDDANSTYVNVTDLWPFQLDDAKVSPGLLHKGNGPPDVVALRATLREFNDQKKAKH